MDKNPVIIALVRSLHFRQFVNEALVKVPTKLCSSQLQVPLSTGHFSVSYFPTPHMYTNKFNQTPYLRCESSRPQIDLNETISAIATVSRRRLVSTFGGH